MLGTDIGLVLALLRDTDYPTMWRVNAKHEAVLNAFRAAKALGN